MADEQRPGQLRGVGVGGETRNCKIKMGISTATVTNTFLLFPFKIKLPNMRSVCANSLMKQILFIDV